jgi:hypothetical protein
MAGKLTAAEKLGKALKEGAKKIKQAERGVSTRVGAAGNKGVRIEKNAKVGEGYGVTDATKGSKALTRAERDKVLSTGRKRIVGGAGVAGGTSLFVNAVKPKDKDQNKNDSKKPIGPKLGDSFKRPRKKSEAKADSPSKSGGRFGQGDNKTLNGKANVSKEQLEKTGLSLREYMNKWNKTDKRPGGSSSAKSSTKSSSKSPKKVGIIKKLLFGSDGKMGGKSGIIDNKVTRAFTKRDEENLAAGLVKKQAGGMMKKKGYARGGAVGMSKRTAPGVTGGAPRRGGTKTVPPKTRAQSRATLSPAQRRLLNSVQGREGSKQSTSVIQDLSDKYGYAPGKRAGAKGGMGKGKRAKPPGMQMGGAVGMAGPATKLPSRPSSVANAGAKAAADAKAAANASAQAQGGPGSARSLANLAAMTRGMNRGPNRPKPTKATAMRGAAARRSGGSTPRGMKNGGTVGKKSARGVGAAKRGFGKAMR